VHDLGMVSRNRAVIDLDVTARVAAYTELVALEELGISRKMLVLRE
jgi:hypothetical protein